MIIAGDAGIGRAPFSRGLLFIFGLVAYVVPVVLPTSTLCVQYIPDGSGWILYVFFSVACSMRLYLCDPCCVYDR